MGLIDKLFGRGNKLSTSDPVFGNLTYDSGIWTHLPTPPGGDCMITIDAPQPGPSDTQRAFYQYVRQSIAMLIQRAIAFVALESSNEVGVHDLRLYSIEMGTDTETRAERFVMELADGEASVVHRVSFESGVPSFYACDD